MMRNVKRWGAVAALAVFTTTIAWAAAADGKWTWKQMGQQGEVAMTLELKQDGEKLTGSVLREGSDTKTDISEGKIKDNEITFLVVREFNGNQFKTTYKGKLDGDAIKGTRTSVRQGQENTVEWMATRSK